MRPCWLLDRVPGREVRGEAHGVGVGVVRAVVVDEPAADARGEREVPSHAEGGLGHAVATRARVVGDGVGLDVNPRAGGAGGGVEVGVDQGRVRVEDVRDDVEVHDVVPALVAVVHPDGAHARGHAGADVLPREPDVVHPQAGGDRGGPDLVDVRRLPTVDAVVEAVHPTGVQEVGEDRDVRHDVVAPTAVGPAADVAENIRLAGGADHLGHRTRRQRREGVAGRAGPDREGGAERRQTHQPIHRSSSSPDCYRRDRPQCTLRNQGSF